MKRAIVGFIGLPLLLLFIVALWWSKWQAMLDRPIMVNTPTLYTIEPGMGARDIAHALEESDIISHPWALVLAMMWQGNATQIKAGEYRLLPGLTGRQLLAQFVAGKTAHHALTLVEGWSYGDIIDAVTHHNVLTRTLQDADGDFVMARLGYAGQHPEGRFFPDTYYFPAGTSDVEFLQRAHKKMMSLLEQEWRQRQHGLPYRTADEALIMASIIEKETAVADEYATIAGVFVRRLQKGMRLQSDPTVIYALGDTFDGNLRRHDLTFDSSYNTYVYEGLPPTPIASPGQAALHAALNPEAGNALYFVAAGDGRHHFSKTLREHNRAVAKYQLRK